MKSDSVTIGTLEDGEKLEINLPVLIRTRLLIQANAGGGKSYTIRKLLEKLFGKVQIIVLDLEGEFGTLREKFDFLLVGKDGDLQADIRSADLLAKKLLELNVSAIIDLYELKHYERILFVKRFLDSMVNAKKELWHPCLVIVDEAHILCPEKGKAESSGSVIDLATRGRKRGFCIVLATQRISKLHKDAVAECNNKLIGRTGLDIDMKRASEELGFTSRQQMVSLRELNAGEFFAFGSAISRKVVKVKIDKVTTTHPEAGAGIIAAPAPATDKIKSVLAKLTDLPQKAEEELKEVQDFKNKIRSLESDLRKTKISGVVDEKQINKAFADGFNKAKKEDLKIMADEEKEKIKYLICLKKISESVTALAKTIPSLPEQAAKTQRLAFDMAPLSYNAKAKPLAVILPSKPVPHPQVSEIDSGQSLNRCERAIYSLLWNNSGKSLPKTMVGILAGYSRKSGGFKNALSHLSVLGLISKNKDDLEANPDSLDEGEKLLGNDIRLFEKFTPENWKTKLPKCAAQIYTVLYEQPETEFPTSQVAEITGYSVTSGGFKNAIANLNSLGLVVKGKDTLKLNSEMFNP